MSEILHVTITLANEKGRVEEEIRIWPDTQHVEVQRFFNDGSTYGDLVKMSLHNFIVALDQQWAARARARGLLPEEPDGSL